MTINSEQGFICVRPGQNVSSKTNERKQMHFSALKQSKFLTRADVGAGVLVTIKEIAHENVAKEGAPEELKYCMYLEECEKPLVLNNTNGAIIAGITKEEDWDNWIGHKIVLYDDPNVTFGGKLVGGIRVRAPRGAAAKAAPVKRPAPPQRQLAEEPQPDAPEGESDIPF